MGREKSEFHDVGDFHQKFGLPNATNDGYKPRTIDPELVKFRLKFLQEELDELKVGYEKADLAQVADALVDLVYVALGTAQLHGLPWEELWAEVQRANMSKERCGIDHKFIPEKPGEVWSEETEGKCHHINTDQTGVCGKPEVAHSKRGSAFDVIKPEGWEAPKIEKVLKRYGWRPCANCIAGLPFAPSAGRRKYHVVSKPDERDRFEPCERNHDDLEATA